MTESPIVAQWSPIPDVRPMGDDDGGSMSCGWLCVIYLVILNASNAGHLYLMVSELHFWAEGAFFYLGITVYTMMMSMSSIFLAVDSPYYLSLPTGPRYFFFVIACLSTALWLGGIIGEIVRIAAGDGTAYDTFFEMVSTYYLVINTS